jgi:3-dehydroquinate synthase
MHFVVEDKTFNISENYKEETEYTIKSIPNPYPVKIYNDSDILGEIQSRLDKNPNNLLIIDANVRELYFKNLKVDEKRIFTIEPNEEFKTLNNGVIKALDFLVEKNFTKAEELIAVGGGITEDIAAFIGACYKRGIKWIFYPTTLLSMCDSCIGGKTGINYHRIKNQIALFSAPREVNINIQFLKTLPEYHIKSGMGEILKLLVTGGKEILQVYMNNVQNGKVLNFDSYKPLLLSSLAVKRAIIEEDEFEKYYRKSLNYGHTIGHSLEVLSEYKIPHGQAVIMGMVIVNKLALDRGILNKKDYMLTQTLSKELLGKSILKEVSTDGLQTLLKNDKKTEGNVINFVIISELGNTKFLKLELNDELINEIIAIIERVF